MDARSTRERPRGGNLRLGVSRGDTRPMTWSMARPAPARVAAPKLAPPSVILSSNLSANSLSQISATPSCQTRARQAVG